MRPRARAKSLEFEICRDGEIPEAISTDPTRLRQILINLLGNAIKFTETGRVELVLRHRPAETGPILEFDVRDTGIGMTPQQAEQLFTPFLQADASMTRRFGGTGLGLAITARLAELLGGAIRVVRTAPQQGSWFRVHIAAEPSAMQPTSPATARAAAATAAQPADRLCARILLVEDGPDNQRLIAHVLRKAGAEVTIAANGRVGADAALAADAAGRPFDVILMDMQMPILDGYSATALLRKNGYGRPIIALTAHAMTHDRERCLAAGCDEFVAKPIDRARLLETIRRYLQPTLPTRNTRSAAEAEA
jgi:CheY-like chemotaxis protein